jgi:hypothetical protein
VRVCAPDGQETACNAVPSPDLMYYEPVEMTCDGLDNDCDGLTDEGCNCLVNGDVRVCSRENSFGTCLGTQICDTSLGWTACDAATPSEEICDWEDNDCDGEIDEDTDFSSDSQHCGDCGIECHTGDVCVQGQCVSP